MPVYESKAKQLWTSRNLAHVITTNIAFILHSFTLLLLTKNFIAAPSITRRIRHYNLLSRKKMTISFVHKLFISCQCIRYLFLLLSRHRCFSASIRNSNRPMFCQLWRCLRQSQWHHQLWRPSNSWKIQNDNVKWYYSRTSRCDHRSHITHTPEGQINDDSWLYSTYRIGIRYIFDNNW